jgi:ribonuclease HII
MEMTSSSSSPGDQVLVRGGDVGRLAFDRAYCRDGISLIAGVDEAGRGCLAGPVVAAAVVLPLDDPIPGVRDSKAMTSREREELFGVIQARALAWSVGVVGWKAIDRFNIYQAAAEAMRRAVRGLSMRPHLVLVDGMNLKGLDIPVVKVVKGDDKSLSIAAASILAKVVRDRLMVDYHRLFPQYGFAHHKGYATREHKRALKRFGPCPIHRRTFKGVVEGD